MVKRNPARLLHLNNWHVEVHLAAARAQSLDWLGYRVFIDIDSGPDWQWRIHGGGAVGPIAPLLEWSVKSFFGNQFSQFYGITGWGQGKGRSDNVRTASVSTQQTLHIPLHTHIAGLCIVYVHDICWTSAKETAFYVNVEVLHIL